MEHLQRHCETYQSNWNMRIWLNNTFKLFFGRLNAPRLYECHLISQTNERFQVLTKFYRWRSGFFYVNIFDGFFVNFDWKNVLCYNINELFLLFTMEEGIEEYLSIFRNEIPQTLNVIKMQQVMFDVNIVISQFEWMHLNAIIYLALALYLVGKIMGIVSAEFIVQIP